MLCRNPNVGIEKGKKKQLRQASMKEACDKSLKALVQQYITQF